MEDAGQDLEVSVADAALTPSGALSAEDQAALAQAKKSLENPGVVARLASAVGQPIEGLVRMLPEGARGVVADAVRKAMEGALAAALKTTSKKRPAAGRSSDRMHQAMVGATGAVGGFFGLPGLAIELPVSTTLMLRSIADIARSQGEDLGSAQARLECLTVFALGGAAGADDAAESAYFAVRAALAKAVAEAAEHLAARGLGARGAPMVARLVSQIAGRFEAAVAEKIAVQGMPIVGSASGAAINVAFIRHFQTMAWGHFTVRRLERRYGPERVREAYRALG
jgi:hypothetical protein